MPAAFFCSFPIFPSCCSWGKNKNTLEALAKGPEHQALRAFDAVSRDRLESRSGIREDAAKVLHLRVSVSLLAGDSRVIPE
jgi:hypothetical protein